MGNIAGYQSDPVAATGDLENTQELLSILPEHFNNQSLNHSSEQNTYVLINKNLVVTKDIRVRPNFGFLIINDWMFSFPIPLLSNGEATDYTGVVHTKKGNPFFYVIDEVGRVFLEGEFVDFTDELSFNINPYIAQLPMLIVPIQLPT